MAIQISWNRIWGLGRAISGLCIKDDIPYWFEWNQIDKVYHAYSLTLEQQQELEIFRTELVKLRGNVIHHDDRYGFGGDNGEESGTVPAMPVTSLEFAFTFPPSDVLNPIPGSFYSKK